MSQGGPGDADHSPSTRGKSAVRRPQATIPYKEHIASESYEAV